MLLELVYNNSAQSYNFQVSFVEGGTHLLSEDYANWKEAKKAQSPAIPAVSHFASLSVSAQGAVGRTKYLPSHIGDDVPVNDKSPPQGRPEWNPLLL